MTERYEPLKDARWTHGSDPNRWWCLTLPQPWAQLTVRGHRPLHDMTFAPPKEMIGHRIRIHAAQGKMTVKRIPEAAREDAERILGISFNRLVTELPRRQIVGSAVIAGAFRIGGILPGRKVRAAHADTDKYLGRWRNYDGAEIHRWGDHSPRRWLWVLTEPKEIEDQPTMRGYSGLFDLFTAKHLEAQR